MSALVLSSNDADAYRESQKGFVKATTKAEADMKKALVDLGKASEIQLESKTVRIESKVESHATKLETETKHISERLSDLKVDLSDVKTSMAQHTTVMHAILSKLDTHSFAPGVTNLLSGEESHSSRFKKPS